jgi:hypothetical protein
MPSRATAQPLPAQSHERQEVRQIDQTFRLAPFLVGQGHAALLPVQQLVQAMLDAGRQLAARQFIWHFDFHVYGWHGRRLARGGEASIVPGTHNATPQPRSGRGVHAASPSERRRAFAPAPCAPH